MRFAAFSFMLFSTFLTFSCQQHVESSPVATSEKPLETTLPSPTPDEIKAIDVSGKFSALANDDLPDSLKINNFEIKKTAVKKSDENDNPEADIYAAVLLKNGKSIARFEGEYHPLGNYMSFGQFPFLSDSGQQLLILDESNRYERDWVISLSPTFEVLYDSKDYDITLGGLAAADLDNDGVYELIAYQQIFVEFGLAYNMTPWASVILKYDSKQRKYVLANVEFKNTSLLDTDKLIEKFNQNSAKNFKDFQEVLFQCFYNGEEEKAWKFFDEKIDSQTPENLPRNVSGKEEIKEKILDQLKTDKIYQYIKKSLAKTR